MCTSQTTLPLLDSRASLSSQLRYHYLIKVFSSCPHPWAGELPFPSVCIAWCFPHYNTELYSLRHSCCFTCPFSSYFFNQFCGNKIGDLFHFFRVSSDFNETPGPLSPTHFTHSWLLVPFLHGTRYGMRVFHEGLSLLFLPF